MAVSAVLWRGVPDSDEVLQRPTETPSQPCAGLESSADHPFVYESTLFDMRVGDRGRKRRRVIAAQPQCLSARLPSDSQPRPSSTAQHKLREKAPGAIPSNWSLSERKKPGNRPAGAAEIRLLYRAPTGEVFKSYNKARKFWCANGQRALRSDSRLLKADTNTAGTVPQKLPEGWVATSKTHSSDHRLAGQAYTIFKAPTGATFTSWQQAKLFIQRGVQSEHGPGGLTGTPTASLADLYTALQRVARGSLKGAQPHIKAALLRTRKARCVKRANRL